MGYMAYVLAEETRQKILETFPPKFPRVIAEHITHSFGVGADQPLPPSAKIEIYGYACTDGIEALAVAVNGIKNKPDGKPYHVTLSLDPAKTAPPEFDPNPNPAKRKAQNYKPAHSSALIATRAGWQEVAVPIEVRAVPRFFEDTPAATQKATAAPSPQKTF
ncbi:MAG: hypothetical protein HY052_09780 [Proteobacteria bacterium]|nr:hypothetical protein [Pseudomonadota bacterium]